MFCTNSKLIKWFALSRRKTSLQSTFLTFARQYIVLAKHNLNGMAYDILVVAVISGIFKLFFIFKKLD